MPKPPRPWAPGEDRLLRLCWPAGDVYLLARSLRRTYQALRDRAAALGLPPRVRRPKRERITSPLGEDLAPKRRPWKRSQEAG